MTPSEPWRPIAEALEAYDIQSGQCPFAKKRTPPKEKPCPKCGAEASEGCREQTVAAFRFVLAVRRTVERAHAFPPQVKKEGQGR